MTRLFSIRNKKHHTDSFQSIIQRMLEFNKVGIVHLDDFTCHQRRCVDYYFGFEYRFRVICATIFRGFASSHRGVSEGEVDRYVGVTSLVTSPIRYGSTVLP